MAVFPPPVTPSRRSGRESRSVSAVRTTSRASACGPLRSAPGGRPRFERTPWPFADLGRGQTAADEPGERGAAVSSRQIGAAEAVRRTGGELVEGLDLAGAEEPAWRTAAGGERARDRPTFR
jgi:hypothetical protein